MCSFGLEEIRVGTRARARFAHPTDYQKLSRVPKTLNA